MQYESTWGIWHAVSPSASTTGISCERTVFFQLNVDLSVIYDCVFRNVHYMNYVRVLCSECALSNIEVLLNVQHLLFLTGELDT